MRVPHSISLTVALMGGLVLCDAVPAAAQAPGYQQLDNRQIFAEFHAEVLTRVNDLMADWGTFWEEDDAEGVAGLYWDNAVVIPPESSVPLRGRGAIQEWLETALPDHGAMEAFMVDFDASGGMAVVYGNYVLQAPGNAVTLATGPVVTVYLQRGRTWKIRSQMFRTGS